MISNITSNNLWIAHVAKDFFSLWQNRLQLTDEKNIKAIGHNFYIVTFPSPPSEKMLSHSIFSRYWLPIDYMWPTKPSEKGFIEKCAQGLAKKFSQKEFQNIIVFSIDRKQQSLASNLRGRLLQTLKENITLFSSEKLIQEWTKNPSSQPSHNKILIVTLSDKCIWAGICPIDIAGSIFGGGRHYVSVSNAIIASRAASKFVESIEFLKLKNISIDQHKKWLELGAAPGGITYELTQRNKEVWAIDKSDLSEEILKSPLVHFHKMDARDFKSHIIFDAIFCDLNGPARLSGQVCSEKTSLLKKHGLVIHTFKIHSISDFEDDFKYIVTLFENKKNSFIAARHLYNNKQEITLFFEKRE